MMILYKTLEKIKSNDSDINQSLIRYDSATGVTGRLVDTREGP